MVYLAIFLTVCLVWGMLLLAIIRRTWSPSVLTSSEFTKLSSPRESKPFSRSKSTAFLKKDALHIWRDKSNKLSFLLFAVLGGMSIWAQFRAGTHSGNQTIMFGLMPMYFIPLALSIRTMALERGLYDFYRVVFPNLGKILDMKLRAQSLLNVTLACMFSIPLFLVHGARVSAGASIFAFVSVLFFTPLLTMLALAMAVYFPSSQAKPTLFLVQYQGLVIYGLLGVVIYALLFDVGEQLSAGSVGVNVAWMLVTAFGLAFSGPVLYCFARRRLDVGNEYTF